ncbi:P24 [Chrysodeixis chalcites nucleopolyhedrovirus]|uniref:p24 n=1 Tax=Chrysodeixis chalcites nucleopolyhedrovirus TaxID=320432 RepID=Q4KSU7_9ABAC|nr:P24 [Chrysodeixis chalcites nucleopolyhedrovirus]AGC36348.1 P24 protein [Chrysodeixis chalcites SNPV TF1-A]AAY84065.1 P24 [Chrysodeixis chalcites nucleopolyhedrovirus]AGE61540.1 P24 protein [Chrysodeixis chalcites nucleopolyhedrovirus]AGE61694.1 P24 protein [Chrysodeixis chalcites nucleopolyhedrovirus]AGE61843.1 P24 protein [Chrysodeixis chalcites nucleopolyhedrovirus]
MYETSNLNDSTAMNGPNNTNNVVMSDSLQQQFHYDDEVLEVVIIENSDDDRDGYVELGSATKLLAPLVTIRNFNKAVLWTNVNASQKLTRNNKNYIHVFSLGKYLSSYVLNSKKVHPPQYFVLKRLFCDLIMGAQSQVVDPLNEIKTQLCTLQECLNTNSGQLYQPDFDKVNINNNVLGSNGVGYDTVDTIREIIRTENASLYSNITSALDSVKSMQADLTNKLAFSNDTMVDSFKSIKDIIIRKK